MNIFKGTIGNNLSHIIGIVVYLVLYYAISLGLQKITFLNAIFIVTVTLILSNFIAHIIFDYFQRIFNVIDYNYKLLFFTLLIIAVNITVFWGSYINMVISICVSYFMGCISVLPQKYEYDIEKAKKEIKEPELSSENKTINFELKESV